MYVQLYFIRSDKFEQMYEVLNTLKIKKEMFANLYKKVYEVRDFLASFY